MANLPQGTSGQAVADTQADTTVYETDSDQTTSQTTSTGGQAVVDTQADTTVYETGSDQITGTSAHGLDADSAESAAEADVIEIKEKMFVAQSNDVYYNVEDYLGKTLKYEGIFQEFTDGENGQTYYSVIRYGPGCCGIDANCGFEVCWVNNSEAEYPKQNDWVEVLGVLELYEEGEYSYLRLNLTSMTVLDVRGAEYVSQ
jgi:uncharacterized membrane protein YcgQ (UPF0703/DUF1980 family)